MMMSTTRSALTAAVVFLGGCGGDGRPRQTHTVRFDVGGAVTYELDPSQALAGVRVTLGDIDGRTFLATTNSAGLWTIRDLDPGIYSEAYELEGYEPVFSAFALDAFGENDVANPFVSRPVTMMLEEPLRASLQPFGVELLDGDELFDGLSGVEASYDASAGDDIDVSFSIPVLGGGYAILEDWSTGAIVVGVLDTAAGLTFTIPGAEIEAMNSGSGLAADTTLQTRHYLFVSADAVTPLHGEVVSVTAVLRFNAVP